MLISLGPGDVEADFISPLRLKVLIPRVRRDFACSAVSLHVHEYAVSPTIEAATLCDALSFMLIFSCEKKNTL